MTALPQTPETGPETPHKNIFTGELVSGALRASFIKLDPRSMAKSPVMFVVLIGAVLSTYLTVANIVTGKS